jgi:AAA family ATP:ADP antiporter
VQQSRKDLTAGGDAGSGEEPPRRDRFLALLRPFGSVRRDEAVTAGALALTVFLLLTAYYVLKVVREPLIMLGGGAEVKRYAAAGQVLLLLVAVRG